MGMALGGHAAAGRSGASCPSIIQWFQVLLQFRIITVLLSRIWLCCSHLQTQPSPPVCFSFPPPLKMTAASMAVLPWGWSLLKRGTTSADSTGAATRACQEPDGASEASCHRSPAPQRAKTVPSKEAAEGSDPTDSQPCSRPLPPSLPPCTSVAEGGVPLGGARGWGACCVQVQLSSRAGLPLTDPACLSGAAQPLVWSTRKAAAQGGLGSYAGREGLGTAPDRPTPTRAGGQLLFNHGPV